ncbi:MAG: tetratricopeptide repeat protein [Actinomycetota bacterium]
MNNGNLNKEKFFLLRSLKDLDEELAKGEISDEDYNALTRRYSKRLARLDKGRESFYSGIKNNQKRKTWLWICFLVSVATISGFAISISSGDRTSSQEMTGSIRQSVVTKLSQAQQLFSDQSRWSDAIDLYEQVLEQQPSNPEALTYRAWLQYRQGESSNEQISVWQEVLIIQPDFPDAIVFLAIALSDQSRFAEAAEQLQNLEKIQVSKELQSVLLTQGLRGEVFAEAKYEEIVRDDEPTLESLEISVEIALEVANYLLQSGKQQRSVSALKLFRAVLQEEPFNPAALSRESLLLAQTGDPFLFERAITQMNIAIQENPMDLEVLLTRATINADVDPVLACEDLKKISSSSFADEISLSTELQSQINSLNSYAACDG